MGFSAYLSNSGEISSGPAARLFFNFRMAFITSSSVGSSSGQGLTLQELTACRGLDRCLPRRGSAWFRNVPATGSVSRRLMSTKYHLIR